MTDPIDFHGLPSLALAAPDGARALVSLHGAHVLSWRPAAAAGGSGDEQMFLSGRAVFADGQPIRGGVPVVFPQFSGRGPLPKHGLVRTRAWRVQGVDVQDGAAVATLVLGDDAASRALWPQGFALALTVRVAARSLSVTLSVHNTGTREWPFTAALHTYLRVDDLDGARLHGLEGCRYWDAVQDIDTAQGQQPLAIRGEVDRVYVAAPPALQLRDGARRLAIAQQGFADTVVWNPGAARCAALSDMAPDGYRQMLCVEAAQVDPPRVLPAGAHWQGAQTLTLIG